jgi:hypothetical protein
VDRFQSATEEFSQFVMSVVSAAVILRYEVPELVVVRRIVQSIHSHVRSSLVLAAEPKSIKDCIPLRVKQPKVGLLTMEGKILNVVLLYYPRTWEMKEALGSEQACRGPSATE